MAAGCARRTIERDIQANDMYGSDKEALEALNGKHQALLAEIGKVIVGQEHVIKEVTTAIFAGGHVLLVGVPGLAKPSSSTPSPKPSA